jgi:tRNA_anti-like
MEILMTQRNKLNAITCMIALAVLSLGCGSLMPGSNQTAVTNNSTGTAPPPTNSAANATASNTTSPTNPNIEKADFTVTAEELDKEFTRKGVKDKDLEKYANKNIAVTGRVSMLVLEKKGKVQPWVTLYAPGVLNGVSCYFDDADVDQMKRLKEDKMVKVQGFMDDFIVPEISPRLDHCQVLEAN